MSIEYATGMTPVNNFSVINDKPSLMTLLDSTLTGAGWTITTTTSSTDKIYQSVVTPQSNQIKVRVWDDGGSTTCLRIRMMNVSQSIQQADSCYLRPAASTGFRCIADQYQFCFFVPGSLSSCNFVLGSALYLPPNLVAMSLTTAAFIMGDGGSDSDTSNSRGTFRTIMTGRAAATCQYWSILNATTVEVSNSGEDSFVHPGVISMMIPQSAYPNAIGGYRWHDDSSFIVEPLVAWGAPTIDSDSKVRGQMWDSFVATDSYPADITTIVDSHNYYNLTNNNDGSVTFPGSMIGSLFMVIP